MVVGDACEYGYLDVGASLAVSRSASEYGYLDVGVALFSSSTLTEYGYLDIGASLSSAPAAVEYAYVNVISKTQLIESYVEALVIPAVTPRNLVDSYIEALAIPLFTPRNLVDVYLEVLTPLYAAQNDLGRDPRIASLTGNMLWLRAKDNSAGSVSTWTDQSGLLHNGFAAGTTPTLEGYSTPLGGKSVRFGGAGSFLCSVAGGAIATASSAVGGEPATNAIDGSLTNRFTTNGIKTGWLCLQLPSARVVATYSIARRDDLPNRNVKDWTFEGSNDGLSWTALEIRSGVTWPTVAEVKTFTFPNTTAYVFYRINFTDNNGDPSYTSIAEIALDHYMNGVASAEIWAVVKANTTSASGLWSFNDRSNGRAFSYYPYPNVGNSVYESFGVNNDSGSKMAVYVDVAGWHIYRVVMDGTNITSYIDGLAIGTHTVASAGGINWGMAPLIGQTAAGNNLDAFFQGNLAEVLVRSQVSTALETGDITNYLQAEHFIVPPTFQGWGIPL